MSTTIDDSCLVSRSSYSSFQSSELSTQCQGEVLTPGVEVSRASILSP